MTIKVTEIHYVQQSYIGKSEKLGDFRDKCNALEKGKVLFLN